MALFSSPEVRSEIGSAGGYYAIVALGDHSLFAGVE